MEHPDVTAAAVSGYAAYQDTENRDSPENRLEYIREYAAGLVEWLRLGYPEILDEFLMFSAQMCPVGYHDWLN